MTAHSPTIVTLHDTRFVECRWWNNGWTVKTVILNFILRVIMSHELFDDEV